MKLFKKMVQTLHTTKLQEGDKAPAFSRRAAWNLGRAYLDVPAQGKNYTAALYAFRNGEWEKFLESNSVSAPAAAGAAEERAYASLEFHKRSQP